MTDAVKLTPEQVAKLSDIMDNTRTRFEEVHQEMNAKGKTIWDEQVNQQLRDRHAREREAREKRRGIQQDPTKK
jgi:hypothetical protein